MRSSVNGIARSIEASPSRARSFVLSPDAIAREHPHDRDRDRENQVEARAESVASRGARARARACVRDTRKVRLCNCLVRSLARAARLMSTLDVTV